MGSALTAGVGTATGVGVGIGAATGVGVVTAGGAGEPLPAQGGPESVQPSSANCTLPYPVDVGMMSVTCTRRD